MMDGDILEVELLLFLSLRRFSRRQKPKKSVKSQDFGLETFFVKVNNIENVVD